MTMWWLQNQCFKNICFSHHHHCIFYEPIQEKNIFNDYPYIVLILYPILCHLVYVGLYRPFQHMSYFGVFLKQQWSFILIRWYIFFCSTHNEVKLSKYLKLFLFQYIVFLVYHFMLKCSNNRCSSPFCTACRKDRCLKTPVARVAHRTARRPTKTTTSKF